MKLVSRLDEVVSDARVRGAVLFTCERSASHRDAVAARVAAYNVTTPRTPELISSLPVAGVPARMTLDRDHAIVLAVDHERRMFRLYEIDAADPSRMKVVRTLDSVRMPAPLDLRDCASDCGLVVTGDDRLLVNLECDVPGWKPLRVYGRRSGAWKRAMACTFAGIDPRDPFADVRTKDGATVAGSELLWRICDRRWGRVAILGEIAIVRTDDLGTVFSTVDRSGRCGKPLKLFEASLPVQLTVVQGYVVVASRRCLHFLHVERDGTLVVVKQLKRFSPREVIATDDFLLINKKLDRSLPLDQAYGLVICTISREDP